MSTKDEKDPCIHPGCGIKTGRSDGFCTEHSKVTCRKPQCIAKFTPGRRKDGGRYIYCRGHRRGKNTKETEV